MKNLQYILKYSKLLALLVVGSAFLLISCAGETQTEDKQTQYNMLTQRSDTLTIINSAAGYKDYRFYAPLMERYELAREPYMEFRQGVKLETFADSLQTVETTFISDYAIFYEAQQLWEAKGNVVATNAQGQVLETQQLFWNQKTKRIYSNVDSKVTQGDDVIVGTGFESDESMEDFIFRRPTGRVGLDVEPTTGADSLSEGQSVDMQLVEGQGSESQRKQVKRDEKPEVEKVQEKEKQESEQEISREKETDVMGGFGPMRRVEQE